MTSEVVYEAVSIPDVVAVFQAMNTTDQCRKADARIAEYIAAIPLINFKRTEDQINYKMDLLSIQEGVRLKFLNRKARRISSGKRKIQGTIKLLGPTGKQLPKTVKKKEKSNKTIHFKKTKDHLSRPN
ncbi:hypothetical protein NPIL_609461 [Nephila pilipes]|uniref:Uncharacterized protein n=1 Tax=Nephila pilipes TaxID=299642 RepID=A0A8X6U566_NEPPI|nr:hypothetical protein NPIL_609461 [Nephila pilipes]